MKLVATLFAFTTLTISTLAFSETAVLVEYKSSQNMKLNKNTLTSVGLLKSASDQNTNNNTITTIVFDKNQTVLARESITENLPLLNVDINSNSSVTLTEQANNYKVNLAATSIKQLFKLVALTGFNEVDFNSPEIQKAANASVEKQLGNSNFNLEAVPNGNSVTLNCSKNGNDFLCSAIIRMIYFIKEN